MTTRHHIIIGALVLAGCAQYTNRHPQDIPVQPAIPDPAVLHAQQQYEALPECTEQVQEDCRTVLRYWMDLYDRIDGFDRDGNIIYQPSEPEDQEH